MLLPALALMLAALQEPADHVTLLTSEEFAGSIDDVRRDGVLVLSESGRKREIPIIDVARIRFEKAPALTAATGPRVRLGPAGVLTGRVRLDGERAEVETSYGTFAFDRSDLRGVQFAPHDLPSPEMKDAKQDVVFWRPDGTAKTLSAAAGRVVSITDASITVRPPAGDVVEVPRSAARSLWIQQAAAKGPPPSGWFARVQFKNGDKIVGTLRSIARDKVTLFSHAFGATSVKKAEVHTVVFVPVPRLAMGHLLVTDQAGVREYDRQLQLVWRYDMAGLAIARKLENGNVLIVSTSERAVREVRPTEPVGGDVVWSIDNVENPQDARRLANGNTLVAEYGASRIVEYDPTGKTVVWQTRKYQNPSTADRLENGNTMIISHNAIVEVDPQGREIWKTSVGGYPWRGERLEDGRILYSEYNGNAVVELDAGGKELSRREVQNPRCVVRLDTGATYVIEGSRSRLVELDAAGKQGKPVPGLSEPSSVTTH